MKPPTVAEGMGKPEIIDGEIVEHLDGSAARKLTDEIRTGASALWDKIVRAFQGRADIALAYASWDEYCIKEFGTTQLRIPREEHPEMVVSLRQAGMSYRAIESATGLSRSTAQREFESAVPNGTPESATVTGLDNKTHPAKRKPKPKPRRDPSPNVTAIREEFARPTPPATVTPMPKPKIRKTVTARRMIKDLWVTLNGLAHVAADTDPAEVDADKHREEAKDMFKSIATITEFLNKAFVDEVEAQ
jgi:hypothetical protein